MPSDPKATPDVRVDGPTRDLLAWQFREWIHEQPFSICATTNMDTCPDWPLAYEMADIAMSVIVSRFPVSAEPEESITVCEGCNVVLGRNGERVMDRPSTMCSHLRPRTYALPVSAEPSPDPLREALEQCVEALRLTREYVGEDTLPAIPGWSWYDATVRACEALAADRSRSDRTSGEATPAEPTYEWRAVGDAGATGPHFDRRHLDELIEQDREDGRDAWIERRVAPGPWERVDDEGRRDG